MKLVTAQTFNDSVSAHLVKTRLENEGIECYIFDENINNIMPIYGQAVGGIRIKIKEEDAPKAKQLIEEWEQRPHLNQTNATLTCTSCGSQEIYAGFKSFKTSLVVIVFNLGCEVVSNVTNLSNVVLHHEGDIGGHGEGHLGRQAGGLGEHV